MNLRSCILLVLAGAIIAVRRRINGAPGAANWRHGGRHLIGHGNYDGVCLASQRAASQQPPPARAGRRQRQEPWSGVAGLCLCVAGQTSVRALKSA